MRNRFTGKAAKTFLVDSLFDKDGTYVAVIDNRTGIISHHRSRYFIPEETEQELPFEEPEVINPDQISLF